MCYILSSQGLTCWASIVHHTSMKKVLAILIITLVWSLAAAPTATQAVLELPWLGRMPIHENLGLLSDPARPEHPVVARTQQAFSSFYGPTWFEHYVDADARYMLNKLYDTFLSSNLPTPISIGRVTVSGSQAFVQIEIKTQESLSGATVVWSQDSKKRWMIVSLSFH